MGGEETQTYCIHFKSIKLLIESYENLGSLWNSVLLRSTQEKANNRYQNKGTSYSGHFASTINLVPRACDPPVLRWETEDRGEKEDRGSQALGTRLLHDWKVCENSPGLGRTILEYDWPHLKTRFS